jgi:hypothetical protein
MSLFIHFTKKMGGDNEKDYSRISLSHGRSIHDGKENDARAEAQVLSMREAWATVFKLFNLSS